MVYFSKKDSKEGAFVIAEFKIKIVEYKKQYALLTAIIQGYGNSRRIKETPEREFSIFCQAIQVLDLPNLKDLGIIEGNRFIFGGLDQEYVKKLKIEGQSPTEIIEYTLYGEKRYFWYYENLNSDKPSSKEKNFHKDYYYYPTYRYIVNEITYEEEFPFHEKKEEKLPVGEVRILQYDEKNTKNFFPVVNKNAWFLEASKYTLSIVWLITTSIYI